MERETGGAEVLTTKLTLPSVIHAKRNATVVAESSCGASTSSAQSILQTLEPRPPHRRNNSRSTRLRVFSLLSPLRPTRPLSRANIGKGRCGDLAPSPAIDRDNFLSPGLRPPSPLGSRDTGATGRRDRSAHSIVAGSFECRDCPVETLDLVREPVTFSLKLVEYRGDIGHGAL